MALGSVVALRKLRFLHGKLVLQPYPTEKLYGSDRKNPVRIRIAAFFIETNLNHTENPPELLQKNFRLPRFSQKGLRIL